MGVSVSAVIVVVVVVVIVVVGVLHNVHTNVLEPVVSAMYHSHTYHHHHPCFETVKK